MKLEEEGKRKEGVSTDPASATAVDGPTLGEKGPGPGHVRENQHRQLTWRNNEETRIHQTELGVSCNHGESPSRRIPARPLVPAASETTTNFVPLCLHRVLLTGPRLVFMKDDTTSVPLVRCWRLLPHGPPRSGGRANAAFDANRFSLKGD